MPRNQENNGRSVSPLLSYFDNLEAIFLKTFISLRGTKLGCKNREVTVMNRDRLVVVWSNKLSTIKKEALRRYCKNQGLISTEIKTRNVFEANREIEKAAEDWRIKHLLIIGDAKEFPSLKYIFRNKARYTDIIYQDLGGEGNIILSVGRVFGNKETILSHLECSYGDSNLAVVFDTTPKTSELPVKALIDLGFKVELLDRFSENKIPLLEDAEMILQYSDGTILDRVHGDNNSWFGGNPPTELLSWKDLSKIKFKYYPFVFSEACSTANFGLLVRKMLEAGGMYLGATSPTYNNPRVYRNWMTCHYCDGYKYGVLDSLDSCDTVGEVKVKVDRELFNTLNEKQQKEILDLEEGARERIDDIEVLATIQFMLFGNPQRPATVGKRASFKIREIPVTDVAKYGIYSKEDTTFFKLYQRGRYAIEGENIEDS